MFKVLVSCLLLISLVSCQNSSNSGGNEAPTLKGSSYSYKETFSKEMSEKVKLPDDFFVMDGVFQVRKMGEDYGLTLFPTPLRTYNLLFGDDLPKRVNSKLPDSYTTIVQADVFASTRGRLSPSFAIGTNGISGIQLIFTHNRKGGLLQIIYNEKLALSFDKCEWRTDQWSRMKLKVVKNGETVSIYGKCWPRKKAEPGEWIVKYSGKLKLDEGQSSIWGIPYSGRHIFYDNLMIEHK